MACRLIGYRFDPGSPVCPALPHCITDCLQSDGLGLIDMQRRMESAVFNVNVPGHEWSQKSPYHHSDHHP